MGNVLKWGTLAFTAVSGVLGIFAPVFPAHTAVMAAGAGAASLVAGLFMHPPWAEVTPPAPIVNPVPAPAPPPTMRVGPTPPHQP
jgi:hypothetical protein